MRVGGGRTPPPADLRPGSRARGCALRGSRVAGKVEPRRPVRVQAKENAGLVSTLLESRSRYFVPAGRPRVLKASPRGRSPLSSPAFVQRADRASSGQGKLRMKKRTTRRAAGKSRARHRLGFSPFRRAWPAHITSQGLAAMPRRVRTAERLAVTRRHVLAGGLTFHAGAASCLPAWRSHASAGGASPPCRSSGGSSSTRVRRPSRRSIASSSACGRASLQQSPDAVTPWRQFDLLAGLALRYGRRSCCRSWPARCRPTTRGPPSGWIPAAAGTAAGPRRPASPGPGRGQRGHPAAPYP